MLYDKAINISYFVVVYLYGVSGSWTIFMRVMFRYLYENGVRPDLLLETIGEIPLLTGMREWLQVGYFAFSQGFRLTS